MSIEEGKRVVIQRVEFFQKTCNLHPHGDLQVTLWHDGSDYRLDDEPWIYTKINGGLYMRDGNEHGFMVTSYVNKSDEEEKENIPSDACKKFKKSGGGLTKQQLETIMIDLNMTPNDNRSDNIEELVCEYETNYFLKNLIDSGLMKKSKYTYIIEKIAKSKVSSLQSSISNNEFITRFDTQSQKLEFMKIVFEDAVSRGLIADTEFNSDTRFIKGVDGLLIKTSEVIEKLETQDIELNIIDLRLECDF
jgi:hypothetical protein